MKFKDVLEDLEMTRGVHWINTSSPEKQVLNFVGAANNESLSIKQATGVDFFQPDIDILVQN